MQNVVRTGDPIPITNALGEGGAVEQVIRSYALPECVEQAGASIEWQRRSDPNWKVDPERPHIRRGLGLAIAMHGTAIPGLDMGGADIKMNDDGSFNLLVGATDLGTGSDTVIGQIVAETLGVPLEDIIIYSSDTDFTPFDVGAYASSTTYISGTAALKAAEGVRQQIFERAALMLNTTTEGMYLHNRQVFTPAGKSVTLAEVALHSLHTQDQRQIQATASHVSSYSPPPFGAQYAEVEVDTETGQVTVKKLVMAVDCGTAINPVTALGQIEGGQAQALGYAVSEEMVYDEKGRALARRFGDYRIVEPTKARNQGHFGAYLRTHRPLRRQSRGRNPHGWGGPGGCQRRLRRGGRTDSRLAPDPRKGLEAAKGPETGLKRPSRPSYIIKGGCIQPPLILKKTSLPHRCEEGTRKLGRISPARKSKR